MSHRLLIISCSQRKRIDSKPLPAIERYDGCNFRMLRKLHRNRQLPSDLDVVIISAKYGLLECGKAITWYEQRMTHKRALELKEYVGASLDELLHSRKYKEVFVNLGKDYLPVLSNSKGLIDAYIIYASGGIGSKLGQMKRWVLLRK